MGKLRQLVSSRAEIGTQAVRVHTPTRPSSCLSPQARPLHCAPYIQFSDLIPPTSPLSGVGITTPIFFALSYTLVTGGAELTSPKVSTLHHCSHMPNRDTFSNNNRKEYLKEKQPEKDIPEQYRILHTRLTASWVEVGEDGKNSGWHKGRSSFLLNIFSLYIVTVYCVLQLQ